MKFDKFMNICFRIISIITGIVVIVGFCVSCFGSPLKAKAFSPADPTAWATLVDEWRDEYENNLTSTLQQINQGLANGDIDASTDAGKRFLAVQALQTLALSNPSMGTILHAVDLGLQTIPDFSAVETLPDTITINGLGSSGVYRTQSDSSPKIVVCQSLSTSGNTGSFVYAPDFTFSVVSPDSYKTDIEIYSGSIYRVRNYFYSGSHSSREIVGTGLAQTYPIDISSSSVSVYFGFVGYIPTLNQVRFQNTSSSNPCVIGGYGQSVTLPSVTIDTETPWNYYNNTILPYIQQNYPEITNNYLVFPYGWSPEPHPDPTEPSTFPNGGIYIDKQYNIGINIIYPTDASGQPITDASGETVTETQYITDTSPLDGEYSFQMPTLAKLNMYDASLPNPDISAYSDGISWIWNACYNILTESGFMPVVMIVFGLALFGFILWKLGG